MVSQTSRHTPRAASRADLPMRWPSVDCAEQHVGIGDGRLLAAQRVASRARLRSRAAWADAQQAEVAHMCDAAASGANFDHVDARNGYRETAALLEAIDAVDLDLPGHNRPEVTHHADLRGGAAHV